MNAIGYAANFLGWPILQITIGSVITHLPAHLFEQENWLTAQRKWEKNGNVYRRWFAVRRWKNWLPDGASWLGGFPKGKLRSRDAAYLAYFTSETRRGEIAHWCMLLCFPLFFIWNPAWACLVMALYAVVANIPCILVQRYNRAVLVHLSRLRNRTVVAP